MPSDLENVNEIQNIFVSDQYIYFVRDKKLERLHIKTNEVKYVNLNQKLMQFQIFDDKYFYWRQYKKLKSYFDIES